jgi:elongation factor Tu
MAKPRLNVWTLGHARHGKTTLTDALVARQAHRNGLPRHTGYLDPTSGKRSRIPLGSYGEVEYETATRHYGHIDGTSIYDYRSRLLLRGGDGAILVVAADEGVKAQTREHVRLARWAGISRFIVFVSKVDLQPDRDLLEVTEWEVRELLCQHDYPGDDVPIIRGNAFAVGTTAGKEDTAARCIDELLAALDDYLRLPELQNHKPFRMAVEAVMEVPGRGPVVVGRPEQGTIRVGEAVEVVGLRPAPRLATITAIEAFNKPLEFADSNLSVGILLAGVMRSDLERGMVLATPGSIRAVTRFEAAVYVLRPEEGGRQTPFFSGYRPQVCIHGVDMGGAITLRGGTDVGVPGEVVEVSIELYADMPLALEVGSRFALREGSRTVGVGTVTRLLA